MTENPDFSSRRGNGFPIGHRNFGWKNRITQKLKEIERFFDPSFDFKKWREDNA